MELGESKQHEKQPALSFSFSYLAPARVLSSQSTAGEPGEGSVSRESRGPAPPPLAQPAPLFLWPFSQIFQAKDKAIKLMKYKSTCKRLNFKTERGLVDKGESCRMLSSVGQYFNISEVSVSCSTSQHLCIYKMPYKIKISPTKQTDTKANKSNATKQKQPT